MTGKVTYEGEPVERGVITLTPFESSGKSDGAKILHGEFRIEGIEPGKKQVSVIGAVGNQSDASQPVVSDDKIKAMIESTRQMKMIPTNAVGNGQTFTVQAGIQEITIELSRPKQR